jgi:hypothetical protein
VFCLGASACTRGGVYHVWSEHLVLHVQTGLKNAVRCPGVVITQCFSFTTFSHLKATPPTVFENGTYNTCSTMLYPGVSHQFYRWSFLPLTRNNSFSKSLNSLAVPSASELACYIFIIHLALYQKIIFWSMYKLFLGQTVMFDGLYQLSSRRWCILFSE